MDGVAEILQFSPVSKSVINIPRSSVKVASPASINRYGCVVPPYNPAEILRYKALDATYQTCIDIKVDTAVGLGYSFGYKDIDKRKDIKSFNILQKLPK